MNSLFSLTLIMSFLITTLTGMRYPGGTNPLSAAFECVWGGCACVKDNYDYNNPNTLNPYNNAIYLTSSIQNFLDCSKCVT